MLLISGFLTPIRIIDRNALVANNAIGDKIGIPPIAKNCAAKNATGVTHRICNLFHPKTKKRIAISQKKNV